MANELGFVGRQADPLPVPVERSRRRFKTGRNVQINIKGEQETKDELYRVADVIDQPSGETLKRALAALVRELATEKMRTLRLDSIVYDNVAHRSFYSLYLVYN